VHDLSTADTFAARRDRLAGQLSGRGGEIGLKKRTSSNLFRYAPRTRPGRTLDLSGFDHVLRLDGPSRMLEAEGLATFEAIVDHTLPHGLVPLITPELKHITIGGATVGIGIESNCFRHGFVHDGMIEAEVVLADGRIVTCTAANEHADLFRALPNSYGTLGYILRVKVRLMPAAPYVHLRTSAFRDLDAYLEAMRAATELTGTDDFVEGLIYGPDRQFLTVCRFTDTVPRIDDILRRNVFYKLVSRESDVYLTTRDYLFRYDPEWFWNLPETPAYEMFRRYAPERFRNSGFYKRYTVFKEGLLAALPWEHDDGLEPLIQDWEVPWEQAAALTRFAMAEVDLAGKPWIVTPIRTRAAPTLYPVRPDALYYNFGCYCQVRKQPGKGDYSYTKRIDRKCFDLGGIKMLYSSTFLTGPEFDRIYNGAAYALLKKKYDPGGAFKTLYQKCVMGDG
jgi:FAD/FMN-containing dehydrogenase